VLKQNASVASIISSQLTLYLSDCDILLFISSRPSVNKYQLSLIIIIIIIIIIIVVVVIIIIIITFYSFFVNIQEWFDYRLQWNEYDYNNIREIRVRSSTVWTPDLLLNNTCEFYVTII